jgi:hypothetical protein
LTTTLGRACGQRLILHPALRPLWSELGE